MSDWWGKIVSAIVGGILLVVVNYLFPGLLPKPPSSVPVHEFLPAGLADNTDQTAYAWVINRETGSFGLCIVDMDASSRSPNCFDTKQFSLGSDARN